MAAPPEAEATEEANIGFTMLPGEVPVLAVHSACWASENRMLGWGSLQVHRARVDAVVTDCCS